VFWPGTRWLALALVASLQISSDLFLRIRLFGPVTYLGLLAFVRSSEWLGLARRLGISPTAALAPDSEARPGEWVRRRDRVVTLEAAVKERSNEDWLCELAADGDCQAAARRSPTSAPICCGPPTTRCTGRPAGFRSAPADLDQLAEGCAQEAVLAILKRLGTCRGESRFTTPGRPGSRPADYFTGQPGTQDWLPVPDAARRSFPPVDVILRQRVVRQRGPSSRPRVPPSRGCPAAPRRSGLPTTSA
jgi:hypothetical protein